MGFMAQPHADQSRLRSEEKNVAVQPRDPFARGPSETFVERVRLAMIFLADPGREVPFVLPDDVHRIVRAASIHNDVLKVRIILVQH